MSALSFCLENKLYTPALALIYTMIDTMAWLSLEEEAVEVRRRDFERLVEQFLLPGSGLACTATELHAARCGILHTHTAQSRRTRAGSARELYYVWGKREEHELQALIIATGRNACAVHVDKLHLALSKAIERFAVSLSQSPTRARVARKRIQKILVRTHLPKATEAEQEDRG